MPGTHLRALHARLHRFREMIQGLPLLLLLLAAGSSPQLARAQSVASGAGTYDPCQAPPTGVQRVRSEQRGDGTRA